MEIKSSKALKPKNNESKSVGATPDDKRLISFRIAHEPSESLSSPKSPAKSPKPTSPRAPKKNFVVTNENAKWSGNSRPLDPRSKPFEVSKPLVVVSVRDDHFSDGAEEEKHGEKNRSKLVKVSSSRPHITLVPSSPPSTVSKEPTTPPPIEHIKRSPPPTASPAEVTSVTFSNRRIESIERSLCVERETNRKLRREIDALRNQLAEARREAEAARREADHEKACATEAHAGLEREAELVWGEAEAWVEHEEALEMREAEQDLLITRTADDDYEDDEEEDDLSATRHMKKNNVSLNQDTTHQIAQPGNSHEDTICIHPPSEPLDIGPTSKSRSAAASPASIEFSDEDDDAWALALFKHQGDKCRTLHLKFSSPQRRPPSPAEAKRRHDERHLGAERNQRRLRDEHARKFATLAAHAQDVRARGEEARSDKEAKTADRHAKAGARHAAYLASVRRKAVRDTAKVQEVGWTNALTSQEVRADLRRRLNEVEARIDLARTRRLDRLKGVQTKLNKRERDKQEQLSAQSLKRAEMATSRWEQLQSRLAAVEARRAARLECLKHLAVKQQEPKKKIDESVESRPASTRRRRCVDQPESNEAPPKAASLSPKHVKTRAKRRNSTGQQPDRKPKADTRSKSDDEFLPSTHDPISKNLEDLLRAEYISNKPKTASSKSKHDRRKRNQRSKRKHRASSIDATSSSTSSSPDQPQNKVPNCDENTVEAALAVEAALVAGYTKISHCSTSSSNQILAAEALLRTVDAVRAKRWRPPTIEAWPALAKALVWALRQWRAQRDYDVEDDTLPFSTASVAVAACEACVAGLQSSAPALAAQLAADAALVAALRDVVAAAGRDEPWLAAATLRVVAETTAAGAVGTSEQRPHIKRLLFSPEPQHEADPDLARIHCVIGAVVAALVMGSVGDSVATQHFNDQNGSVGAPISPPKKPVQHTAATPPHTARQSSPLDKWRLAVAGVDALNAVARFDRTALNETVFAAGSHRPQLLHVLDRLFVDALESSNHASPQQQQDGGLVFPQAASQSNDQAALNRAKEACLDAVVELVGHFALDNQECLQWGMASRVTLLHRLVRLPFKYFSRPQHKDVLFPTLIACCLDNDRNVAVAAEEMSVRVLADYLRTHVDVMTQERSCSPPHRKNVKCTPNKKQEQLGLRGRVPEHLWPRALAYFDRLCDAETLD